MATRRTETMTELEVGRALRALAHTAERSAERILVDSPTEAEDVAHRIVRRLLERRSLAEILELGAPYFKEAGRLDAIATLRDERRRRELLAAVTHAAPGRRPRRPDETFAANAFTEQVQEWIACSLPPRTAEIARLAWFERCT